MRLRVNATSSLLLLPLIAMAAPVAHADVLATAPTPTTTPTISPTESPTPTPTTPPTYGPDAQPVVDNVVMISVDGFNPNALRKLGRTRAAGFYALMDSGASTLNARTALELTVTLPNHTGMVTGRRINVSAGGHGVTWNDDRLTPNTVQAAAGGPVSSVFSQVKASGGSSALFAAKTKFSLWQRSWPTDIDQVTINENNAALVSSLIADLPAERDLRFLHISLPDRAGHAKGFMSQPYLNAVARSSRLVAKVVKAVNASPSAATTAIVLTADHGGAKYRNHADRHRVANYRIPMIVVGPGVEAGTDLYKLNPDYLNPGSKRPGYTARRQPIRNAAAGNLALDLLGLEAIPGSTVNSAQNLDVRP